MECNKLWEVENLLLRYLRLKAHLTPEKATDVLGIDLSVYQAIQHGEQLLTRRYAYLLGKYFDIGPGVLHATSLHLEILRRSHEQL